MNTKLAMTLLFAVSDCLHEWRHLNLHRQREHDLFKEYMNQIDEIEHQMSDKLFNNWHDKIQQIGDFSNKIQQETDSAAHSFDDFFYNIDKEIEQITQEMNESINDQEIFDLFEEIEEENTNNTHQFTERQESSTQIITENGVKHKESEGHRVITNNNKVIKSDCYHIKDGENIDCKKFDENTRNEMQLKKIV